MIDFTNFKTDAQKMKVVWANFQSMKTKRFPYQNLWDVENRLFLPRRYDLLRQDQPGQQYGSQIYDGHPANVANKFSLGFLSYMISRSVPWLRLKPTRRSLMEHDEVKQYFQDATTQVLWSFDRSNFYGESVWFSKDATVLGTAYSTPEEDLVSGSMRYRTIQPGECYIEDDQWGRPGIFMRFPVRMTAMQALEKFGKENLPKEVVDNAQAKGTTGNPFTECKFLEAVYKNINSLPGSLNPKDMPFKVFWILLGKTPKDMQLVEESGRDWSAMTWRIGKEPGHAYGTSLAADALTEALQTNKLGQKVMEAAHIAVDPPVYAHKDLRNRVNLRARGRTWTDDNKQRVTPVFGNLNWPVGDKQMQRFYDSLDDKFHIRFLEMLTSRDIPANITAYQIQQMVSEKAILMNAIVGTFEDEYLKQAIDIQFAHEVRAGRMPDPPDILFDDLQGEPNVANLDISYEGPLAKMQTTLLEAKPLIDGIGLIKEIGSIWPDSLIKINEMKLIEDAGTSSGWDQGLFKSDQEVNDIMVAANAQEARDQQLAEAMEASKAIPALSGAVDENSVLAQAV